MSKVGDNDFLAGDIPAEQVLEALENGPAGHEFEQFLEWQGETPSVEEARNLNPSGIDFQAFSTPLGERVQGELNPRVSKQSGLDQSLGGRKGIGL